MKRKRECRPTSYNLVVSGKTEEIHRGMPKKKIAKHTFEWAAEEPKPKMDGKAIDEKTAQELKLKQTEDGAPWLWMQRSNGKSGWVEVVDGKLNAPKYVMCVTSQRMLNDPKAQYQDDGDRMAQHIIDIIDTKHSHAAVRQTVIDCEYDANLATSALLEQQPESSQLSSPITPSEPRSPGANECTVCQQHYTTSSSPSCNNCGTPHNLPIEIKVALNNIENHVTTYRHEHPNITEAEVQEAALKAAKVQITFLSVLSATYRLVSMLDPSSVCVAEGLGGVELTMKGRKWCFTINHTIYSLSLSSQDVICLLREDVGDTLTIFCQCKKHAPKAHDAPAYLRRELCEALQFPSIEHVLAFLHSSAFVLNGRTPTLSGGKQWVNDFPKY
eukprot:TRINITY_DN12554_c0_g1_i1.p1 TRINITY_DN12554_c0_g1~~TRINITY_DN12554_c0_g1_i1.p1  ORF type:complete len:404 (+),score=77.79 TRINITY_DN12554_c0_g1_i1:55-1212(+)